MLNPVNASQKYASRNATTVNPARLYAVVQRGNHSGIVVRPHKYRNEKYRVARKKADLPIEVELVEIETYIQQGFGVYMSNKSKRYPAGLIRPRSILGRSSAPEARQPGVMADHIGAS